MDICSCQRASKIIFQFFYFNLYFLVETLNRIYNINLPPAVHHKGSKGTTARWEIIPPDSHLLEIKSEHIQEKASPVTAQHAINQQIHPSFFFTPLTGHLPYLCASPCTCPLSPSTHRSCQTAQRWASGPSLPGFGVFARWKAWWRQAPSLRSLGRNNNTHIHTHIFRDTYRVEAVRRSRQELAGLNSHCTGGANRRPRMEVQMGAFGENGRLN